MIEVFLTVMTADWHAYTIHFSLQTTYTPRTLGRARGCGGPQSALGKCSRTNGTTRGVKKYVWGPKQAR
jgi:hypothetical protein